MFNHHGANLGQFVASESFRTGKLHGLQPIFCHPVTMLNVDMRRFAAFAAEKEKPESVKHQDRRHIHSLAGSLGWHWSLRNFL